MRGKTIAFVTIAVLCLLGSFFTLYSHVLAPMLRADSVLVKLYFADAQSMQVVPEERLIAGQPTPELLINELIKGPTSPKLWATLPPSTRLIDVEIEERTAVVNLSQEAMDNHSGGSAAELMLVYSVVATLTDLPQIDDVQFLIEGKVYESIWGHMDTTVPIQPDESFIAR